MAHKNTLRELAKFASGLVAADFLAGLWWYFNTSLPRDILGMHFSDTTIMFWMVFDAIVFLFLIHYGWRIHEGKQHSSPEKMFHRIVGVIFGIVALLHLARLFFGFDFTIGGWNFPYWLNGLGAIVAGILSYLSFKLID